MEGNVRSNFKHCLEIHLLDNEILSPRTKAKHFVKGRGRNYFLLNKFSAGLLCLAPIHLPRFHPSRAQPSRTHAFKSAQLLVHLERGSVRTSNSFLK